MSEGILNPIQQLQADFDFDVYTKQEVDILLDGKADKVDTYTKTETDALLNEKADVATTYTKTETNNLLNGKADKSTTLAGYGITDAYTKAQTDNLLNGKADTNSVYTKEETDNLLSAKANSADVYTKTETNNLLSAKADSANVYTKTEADTLLAGKADTDDVYTKAQTDTLLSVKANSADVYTKTESNTLLAGKANVDDVYTKTEIDNQLTVTKDGTWVKGTQTTATNLEKLEGGIEYLYGLLSHKYSQLRKYINGNYYDYETNTDSAYTKSVPAGAMPYAGLERIGGKTLVWNQLAPNGYSKSGAGTVALNEGASIVKGHKYLISRTLATADNSELYFYVRQGGTSYYMRIIGTATATIETAPESGTSNGTASAVNGNAWIYQGATANTVTNLMLIDLTLLYGSGNEPTTVEQFREMFPASYYPYNAGELLSAGVAEVVSKGKNYLPLPASMNPLTNNGITVTPRADGSYTIVGTATQSANISLSLAEAIPIPQNAYIHFRNSVSNGSITFPITDDNNVMFTAPGCAPANRIFPVSAYAGRKIAKFGVYVASGKTVNMTIQPSVELSSTATDYTPYKAPIQYPIPAEIRALEGYGWSAGTAYNYIDYERKVFVQNVGRVDLGTLNWFMQTPSVGNYFQVNSITPKISGNNLNAICPLYTTVNPLFITTNSVDKVIGIANATFSSTFRIRDTSYTDVATFKTAMNGVYLYYELAEPIETDISAYLSDDNLIEVEAGGTLTFENQHGDNYRIPVPSEEEYMINLQEAVSNG